MIRRYTESDAARCCEIINACLPQIFEINDAARAYMRSKNIPYVLHAELEPLYAVVYEMDTSVLGLGALDGSKIKRVYVDPAHQRKGVGCAIMAELENEAMRQGLDAIRIQARSNALPFYRTLGYRVQGRDTFAIGQSQFTVISMEKSLGPSQS